ncbi:MAG: helix-turn-helix transcriptional regulator [Clostridia bacterium]|nr:helix-turn-helix transcriptional regulator [Clostridia bacterium]
MNSENLTAKEIIERISYIRTKKNISAYKMSKDLGHSKTYFYRIESGEMQLTINNLIEVLQILGVTTSEFFCPTLNEEDKLILNNLNNLSDDNKKTILDLIKKLQK